MKTEFDRALTQVCNDRGLSRELLIEAIEAGLVSAYKRDFGAGQDISVKVDGLSGDARVFAHKEVVEEVVDPEQQLSVEAAQKLKPEAELGDVLAIELTPRNFGRIAAQTAKQVILQRIREAERDTLYVEYQGREGEIINGTVQNIDPRSRAVTIYLGKIGALLPASEQIRTERYRFNQRLRVFVLQVEKTSRGPQVVVSRTHRGLLRRLMELEVPEIFNGTVEIKAIAREAGSRSKVAVAATQPGVDPVGSCVGMRGVRIQHIVNELSGEKIDVVAWAADEDAFIASALSPAKAVDVRLDEETRTAVVVVPDRQLSLAIGKEGQNARLAAKLTGWRIDIKSETEAAEEAEQLAAEEAAAAVLAEEKAVAQAAALALLAEAEATLTEEEAEEVPAEEAVAEAAVAEAAELSEEPVAEIEAEALVEEAPQPEGEVEQEEPVAEVVAEEEAGAPQVAEELAVEPEAEEALPELAVELLTEEPPEIQAPPDLEEPVTVTEEPAVTGAPEVAEPKKPTLKVRVSRGTRYSEEELEKELELQKRPVPADKKKRKRSRGTGAAEPRKREPRGKGRGRPSRGDWLDYVDEDEEF
jgi:N utilization substance protein A